MADNYLEKKMDDYVRGRGVSASRRASAKAPARPYEGVRIFVILTHTFGEKFFAALAGTGARIAFAEFDFHKKRCTLLAQKYGLRYYPVDSLPAIRKAVSDAREYFGALDAVFVPRNRHFSIASYIGEEASMPSTVFTVCSVPSPSFEEVESENRVIMHVDLRCHVDEVSRSNMLKMILLLLRRDNLAAGIPHQQIIF